MTAVKHPARYSKEIMPVLQRIIEAHRATVFGGCISVLDPFAGTGLIHSLATDQVTTVGVEIEPEWAMLHPCTIIGDATHLHFQAGTFDMVVTSPTYGNRLADHHDAKDPSERRSYTHDLQAMTGDRNRKLAPNNTGTMLWTHPQYRSLHRQAWAEVWRVLARDGLFVLNVKDWINRGQVQEVCAWHRETITDIGFDLVAEEQVECPGLRYGTNAEVRVPYEMVYIFAKPKWARV